MYPANVCTSWSDWSAVPIVKWYSDERMYVQTAR